MHNYALCHIPVDYCVNMHPAKKFFLQGDDVSSFSLCGDNVPTTIWQWLSSSSTFQTEELSVLNHMPQLPESGLSTEEHRNFTGCVKGRKISCFYCDEDLTKIAKYAVKLEVKVLAKGFLINSSIIMKVQ